MSLNEKEVQSGIRGGDRVFYTKEVKEAIEGAEKDLKEEFRHKKFFPEEIVKIINKIWEKRFGEFK